MSTLRKTIPGQVDLKKKKKIYSALVLTMFQLCQHRTVINLEKFQIIAKENRAICPLDTKGQCILQDKTVFTLKTDLIKP